MTDEGRPADLLWELPQLPAYPISPPPAESTHLWEARHIVRQGLRPWLDWLDTTPHRVPLLKAPVFPRPVVFNPPAAQVRHPRRRRSRAARRRST